jgi:hypothetical protein
MYIVVRNLEDGRPSDYKVFTASNNAVSLAEATRQDPYVRLKNGDEARVVGCKIYRAPTTDAREAIRMLEDGRATPLYKGHDWMIVSPTEHYKTDTDWLVDLEKRLSKDEIEKLSTISTTLSTMLSISSTKPKRAPATPADGFR